MFETNNVGMKDCDWFGMRPNRKERYCNQSFGEQKMKQKYRVSCGLCTLEEDNPLEADTASPSSWPSKDDGETASGCSDDLTFYINKDEATCDWWDYTQWVLGVGTCVQSTTRHLLVQGHVGRAVVMIFTFMTDNAGPNNCEWLGKKQVRIGTYFKRNSGSRFGKNVSWAVAFAR